MNKIQRGKRGFTLVELLSVLVIMLVLGSLSLPAIQGARSTYDRKTAVDLVLSTIEQARVASLQSGENTYVILALAGDSGVSPDALIVAGDPPLGAGTGEVFYTHWIRLPLNVRFRSSTGTLVTTNTLPTGWSNSMLPPISGNPTYASFTFNSTGTISSPASGSGPNGGLDLALYEGTRASSHGHSTETALGASAAATDKLSDSGLYDVIRLSRYTGRSWADVSTLEQK